MTAAAYTRGSRAIVEELQRQIAASLNTNMARAKLWEHCLEAGAILTFEGEGGAVIVAGPNVKAAGKSNFSVHRYGGAERWRGAHEDNAWGIALRIVEHVGRKRPVRIVVP